MTIEIYSGFLRLTEPKAKIIFIKGSSINSLSQNGEVTHIVTSSCQYFTVNETPADILQAIELSYKQARASR